MTNPMQQARERALVLVGQGYIYGAKGQTCSPAFRARQAEQYPEQAKNILGVGAKWDGVPVWDCAQLTRTAAASAGVTLPSGATSQWQKGPWKRKGEIGSIPQGETVFVYRRQAGSQTVMAHTGVALGDGTCVHARGTAYGVVRQRMEQYAWTHWASPWAAGKNNGNGGNDMDNETNGRTGTGEGTPDRMARVTGGRLALRPEASTGSGLLFWMPDGTEVAILEDAGDWCRVRYDREGIPYMGWCMSRFLASISDADTGSETGESGSETIKSGAETIKSGAEAAESVASDDPSAVALFLQRDVAEAVLKAVSFALGRG